MNNQTSEQQVSSTTLTWSNYLDKLLSDIKVKCDQYIKVHEEQCTKYSKKNSIANIISILFAAFSGTISSINNDNLISDNDTAKLAINIILPILAFTIAIVNGVQQSFDFSGNSYNNHKAANGYIVLSNNINRVLSIPYNSRPECNEFYLWVVKEFDNLVANSPKVHQHIGDTKQVGMVSMTSVKISDEEKSKSPAREFEISRFMNV